RNAERYEVDRRTHDGSGVASSASSSVDISIGIAITPNPSLASTAALTAIAMTNRPIDLKSRMVVLKPDFRNYGSELHAIRVSPFEWNIRPASSPAVDCRPPLAKNSNELFRPFSRALIAVLGDYPGGIRCME